jgi:hypothetical protein
MWDAKQDLALTGQMDVPVWCLKNDVERWSIKLRDRFDLEIRFSEQSSAARLDPGNRILPSINYY